MTDACVPISQLPIFSQLTAAELVLVSRAAREVRYAKGQRVFSPNRPADACWIIRRGRVALDTWLVPPYRWHFGATEHLQTS